ncbi:MAG: MoaD/ThiS family protein [Acidobacteriota bacterium]
MPKVTFTANLKRHVDVPEVDVEATTVRDALERAFAVAPNLRPYILDDQGRLRRHVNVFVGGAPVVDRKGLTDAVGEDEAIYVMQALSGGAR